MFSVNWFSFHEQEHQEPPWREKVKKKKKKLQPQKNIYDKVKRALHVWRRNADIFCTNRLQTNLFCCFLSNRWQKQLSSTLDNILKSLPSINSDGSRGMVTIPNSQDWLRIVIKSNFTIFLKSSSECHWFRIFSFKNSETYTYNQSKEKKSYCVSPKNLLKYIFLKQHKPFELQSVTISIQLAISLAL